MILGDHPTTLIPQQYKTYALTPQLCQVCLTSLQVQGLEPQLCNKIVLEAHRCLSGRYQRSSRRRFAMKSC